MLQTPSPTKSLRQKPPLSEAELVAQLNMLLTSLHIPILLISPTDLTPALLIAILEALMGERLPIHDRNNSSSSSKIQSVKIFLGVLETDLLQMDVGLSALNPHRLAEGEMEEMTFIAELLCWIGRRKRLVRKTKKHKTSLSPAVRAMQSSFSGIPPDFSSETQDSGAHVQRFPSTERGEPWHGTASSSSPRTLPSHMQSTLDPSTTTDDYSLLRTPPTMRAQNTNLDASTDGSVLSSVTDILGLQHSFQQTLSTPPKEQHPQPLCIHQIPPPTPQSLLFSQSQLRASTPPSTPPRRTTHGRSCPEHILSPSCTCDLTVSPVQSPPIRYSGFIHPVDEESEIASFELNRSVSSPSTSSTPTPRSSSLGSRRAYTTSAVKQEYARTLELLNERARLLSQLAELNNAEQYG